MKGIVQIAGVLDEAEARLLVDAGVDRIGFPLRLPVHREDLADEAAARIVRALPPAVKGVVITYLARAEEIRALCRKIGSRYVQLHGEVGEEELATLRASAPELIIMKSLIVRGDNGSELVAAAGRLSPYVDAYITDTYDPVTGACGATGKIHDWNISRRLVEVSPRPLILAGGLTAENVRPAVFAVRPAGVDAHTGLERPDGRKDPDRVRAFVKAAREAFSALDRPRGGEEC